MWSIDMDDFSGRCGSGKYPLVNALRNELEGYKVRLEFDGPYEAYKPGGKYTTKDRKLHLVFNFKITLTINKIFPLLYQLMQLYVMKKVVKLVITQIN